MDIEPLNAPWSETKIYSLINGLAILDDESGDGERDVPLVSFYQLKCYAYDNGRQEAMLDCIQLERAVERIPDLKERAAVTLRMMGWSYAEIGAAIGSRRTGLQMFNAGVKSVHKSESLRSMDGLVVDANL